ncbi:MAG: HEPN domain-containing protein [Gammaproteobacteria bacterium]|nr:HEPN domain-containing protein [Gammaproteobacteria bacterium]
MDQIILNTFARNIFRKQADCDYIAARSNYRTRLRQQFLWSAQQAIEKYLKAILLFNGRSARYILPDVSEKEFIHNLDTLLVEIQKISHLKFEIEPDDQKFLSYLSHQGGKNRYLSTSAYNTSDAIHRLDRLVWHIRRYCQYIPDRGIGFHEAVPGMREAFVSSINDPSWKKLPHSFTLFAGEAGDLERLIKSDPKDPARLALLWANLFYGKKKRLHVIYDSFSSTEIPPNENMHDYPNVDWKVLEKFVKL